jgi:cytidylate kinase
MSSDRARLVTVSASYGAGGAVVAPALAERLGVPFLQRATTSSGGSGPEPCFERLGPEEAKLTPAHRLLVSLMQTVPLGPTQSPIPAYHQDESLRQYCEEGIRRMAADNAGVILGRGAAVVLGKNHGFHVRLDGPADLRVVQGASIEAIGPDEARRHLEAADRARDAYVRRLYRADPTDTRHYHLVIDSTAIPLDAVTELILQALAATPDQASVPAPRATATGQ